jgi:FKBP-type peptidyl-prolyl cis-trans isomerase (trigger factor)
MDPVMQGVCSAHWLEADEAARGAERIEHELRQVHAEQAESKVRQAQMLREAARLRTLQPETDRVQRILEKIVARFWSEAAEESGRNQALAGAAWAVGRLVAGGELAEAEAVQRMVAEGTQAGLPAHEADYVVRQQVRRARVKPRVLERKSEWAPRWEAAW